MEADAGFRLWNVNDGLSNSGEGNGGTAGIQLLDCPIGSVEAGKN
jgi:hypothetical protein